MLQAIQIGLNTADLPGSLRLHAEAFGFANAGGQALWGNVIRVQGLGPESRALMWWMVGQQPHFQLELFHHSQPKQRPLPADWRPSDHGWVRYGVAVADFDACLAVLERQRIALLAAPLVKNGMRRAAFRDPYAGVIVEVMEQGVAERGTGPRIRYITSSVADIDTARSFYRDVLEMEIASLEELHDVADEALWGLGGAERNGFLVRAGTVFLEIVGYRHPAGRAQPADHRISDQGIMNVALGSRDRGEIARALQRLEAAGYMPPFRYEEGGILCGYITARGRELEMAYLPAELEAALGFKPVADFLR